MKRLPAYTLAGLAVLLILQGCAGRGHVIPKDTLSHIYAEMFVADQWLKDHPSSRKTADTTFFYEPVFKKYGYNSKDYDASLRYYTRHPEKFSRLLEKSSDILEQDINRMKGIKNEQELARKFNEAIKGYVSHDFADSTMWSETVADSILTVIKENAERRDSIRTDSLEAPGQLAGAEPLAEEREDL